jgi:alpha,alpha-trehalase
MSPLDAQTESSNHLILFQAEAVYPALGSRINDLYLTDEMYRALNPRCALAYPGCGWLSLALAILLAPGPLLEASYTDSALRAVTMENRSRHLDDVLQYISVSWDDLTRSLGQCKTYEDQKTNDEPFLYFPADFRDLPHFRELEENCRVHIERLPEVITSPDDVRLSKIHAGGLLYLPYPYVVPGGQFNEMYGWDSYFIILGLLRANRVDLARGMVENFFFEIQHYGSILNANRTYYLTRSQPPFLTSMILAVYDAEVSSHAKDDAWLKKAYEFAVSDYQQWTRPPHLAGDTGLSRYFDHGEGPVPEIIGDPSDYYAGAAQFFMLLHGTKDPHLVLVDEEHPVQSLVGPLFTVFASDQQPKDPQETAGLPGDQVTLSADFYKGDRSMRESGFDVSFRFGPFSAETHHFAPVCLNSLLFKTEKDLERISSLLGRQEEAESWKNKAIDRQQRIQKYLWDAKRGLYFDYNFMTHTLSSYEYATTFYPLWVGLASKEQAQAVVENLPMFEQPGGLAMSRVESQAQWDYPYGWAPIQLLAVEGMRRYGFVADADRVTYNFLSMVVADFVTDRFIREKYNVVKRTSETRIVKGYSQNVIGFGWTNGVFLELLSQSSPALLDRLEKE